MKKHTKTEALRIRGVYCVNTTHRLRRPDTGMPFDHTALFTPLELFPRSIPCVVPRNITVEERLGKCILAAEVEECSQRRMRCSLQLLLLVTWSKIYPLAILQMDAEVHNSGVSLVDGEPENSPNGLVATYVPSQQEILHFI